MLFWFYKNNSLKITTYVIWTEFQNNALTFLRFSNFFQTIFLKLNFCAEVFRLQDFLRRFRCWPARVCPPQLQFLLQLHQLPLQHQEGQRRKTWKLINLPLLSICCWKWNTLISIVFPLPILSSWPCQLNTKALGFRVVKKLLVLLVS